MRFEDMCFLPIDRSAILPEMLSTAERTWINQYHRQVYDKLSVNLDEEHRIWLKAETEGVNQPPGKPDDIQSKQWILQNYKGESYANGNQESNQPSRLRNIL